MRLILILLIEIYTQPCSNNIQFITTQYDGVCVNDAQDSDLILLPLDTQLGGISQFTVTFWFKPIKSTNANTQAIFRVSADTSDVTQSGPNGVRLGMLVNTNPSQTGSISILYAKKPATTQQFSSTFGYTSMYWCFGAAGISYTLGKVSYYAWQPSNPTLQVNPLPQTESIGFNDALPPNPVLQLFYWGLTYVRFCGSLSTFNIYSNYIELDYKHNWFQLAILSNTFTYSQISQYRLEETSGQYAYDKITGNSGRLGTTTAVDASDPTWGTGYLQFGTADYVLLQPLVFGSTNKFFGVSFWFFLNGVSIGTDADNTDLIKDIVVMKKFYQGTTEQFGILFYVATASNFGTKLKLNGVQYIPSNIQHLTGQWHFLTLSLMYPGAVKELTNIMYDIMLENSVFQAHQVTTLSSAYQESATDTIFLGDVKNSFSTGSMLISNVNFFNTYSLYIGEDSTYLNLLSCNLADTGIKDCEISTNTLSSNYCLYCHTLKADNGICRNTCVSPGGAPLTNTIAANSGIRVCRSCYYTCTQCTNTGNCLACATGYYLDGTNCVVSASCSGGKKGNPNTGTCVNCGNGSIQAGETCDDNNFTNGDGCTNCALDTGYKCPTVGAACVLKCGDGVLDAGEQCDDGNTTSGDGCDSTCVIESATYSCVNAAGPPASTCTKLCGNGSKAGTEQCDDGNPTSGDGCSSSCQIEIGWACVGSTPSVCTKLCGNAIVDSGEQCDDGNVKNNDGCSDCVVDGGWACSNSCPTCPSICSKICGNGVKDTGEQCDDGNTISNDGCTNCLIDTDYICTGGSSSSQDKCTIVPDICGDGIKKSTEQCDDGNTTNGDGCSNVCQIEIGYYCNGGSVISKSFCYAICGDGKKLSTEQCDDGNTYGGDGCSELCVVEQLYVCQGGSLTRSDICSFTCGNGQRDLNGEQCDDGNQSNGDGCSQYCQIEPNYGCIQQTQSYDLCFKCVDNCAQCQSSTVCDVCYTGFYQFQNICIPGCPFGYYDTSNTCSACEAGCSLCTSTQCNVCQYNYFLQGKLCYKICPDGYYPQTFSNGNKCTSCTAPCSKCSSTQCFQCADTYYIDKGVCKSCGMGEQCLKCDTQGGECLQCSSGYYRSGSKCLLIPAVCGDGLKHPLEFCDDGNQIDGDGCSKVCKVEVNWDCVLYETQGPDICFTQEAPSINIVADEAFSNIILVKFSRPLQQGINFTNFTTVTIPELDSQKFVSEEPVNSQGIVIVHNAANAFIPYTYNVTQTKNQTIQIKFNFKVTVKNYNCSVIFTNLTQIKDIYNWSLANQQVSRRLLQNQTDNLTISYQLPYYVYYDDTDKTIYEVVGVFTLIFCIISLIAAGVYQYLIGEGRTRKIVEFIQIISILRYLNLYYSQNMDVVFKYLYIMNLNWMPNIFQSFKSYVDQDAVQYRFRQVGYSCIFLEEAGGRLITILLIAAIIIGINEIIFRIVKFQLVEYYTEQFRKLFTFQGFILIMEIFYLDVMISIFIQFSNIDVENTWSILNFVIAILVFIIIASFQIAIYEKLIRNPKVIRVTSIYEKYGLLFDGLLFNNAFTKIYALVPYFQKTLMALVLVFTKNAFLQTGIIFFIRLIFYSFSFEQLPIYYLDLFIRDIAYDITIVTIAFCMLAFSDPQQEKQSMIDAGYGISSFIIVVLLVSTYWVRYAYQNIDRLVPPDVPDHEEIREEQQVEDRDKHILQQNVEMQRLEHDFFNN